MKASELISQLEELIDLRGDGPVCISTLDKLIDVEVITGGCTELETGEAVHVLWPEGPPLVEAEDTDQSIAEEIAEIGLEVAEWRLWLP